MAKLKHEGKVILDRDVAILTPEYILAYMRKEQLVKSGRRIVVRQGAELRLIEQLPPTMSLGANVETKTIPGGTVKGAPAKREHFIKAQVASVAEVLGEKHGQLVQLDTKLQFVIIPQFRLPRRWGMRTTPILIWFPQGYPEIPPHGFYLSKHCVGPHILAYNVYKDSPDLSAKGWNWYCVNPKGWAPKADPLEPDNLWTFLDVVRTSLSVDEF